jgi:hypothetical protein
VGAGFRLGLDYEIGSSGRSLGMGERAWATCLSVRPSVSVVVVVPITTSSSADCTGRRLMSPATNRETSSRRPIRLLALQAYHRAEGAGAAIDELRFTDERAVSHRDQPVGGRRDPLVVRDDDQGLTVGVQLLEQPKGP